MNYSVQNVTRSIVETQSSVQNGNQSNTKLIESNIYQGVVAHVDYVSKRLTVCVDDQLIQNCIYATNTIAALLGFASTQLPPVGAKVVCLFTGSNNWVIGTQPMYKRNIAAYAGDVTGAKEYSQIGDKELATYHDHECEVQHGYPMSRDILPGEEEYTNNMGVALRLLQDFAQLDAGGIAKIECHLYNDMVRIVDNYYAHHHCGGDTLIWSNGTNNKEDHFTQYVYEAAGKTKPDDPYAEPFEPFDQQDVYTIPAEVSPISSTGFWRKSSYLGFLGDMLHYWVSHPVEVIQGTASQLLKATRFKTWVGADGTLMVQTAGEVMIEVTQHMIIPEVHCKWDDPAYDPDKILANLNIEYLKLWGEGKRHWEDLTVATWQMRNYLKYITLWHSLERFKQMENASKGSYCSIPKESEAITGSPMCGEKDKEQANPEVKEVGGHCLLHMSQTGSLTVVSNNCTSTIMDNGNIQLSAPYNIEIKAGNVFSVTARDVVIKAHRNIELLSMAGSIFVKARTALKALCEAGKVWIKGDAPATGELHSPYPDQLEFNKYSIILDSSQGETLVYGNKGVTVGTNGPSAKVNIEATGSNGCVDIFANSTIKVYGQQQLLFKSRLQVSEIDGTYWYGRLFNMFNKHQFSVSSLEVDVPARIRSINVPTVIYSHSYASYEQEHLGPVNEDDRDETQAESYPVIVDHPDSYATIKSVNLRNSTTDYYNLEFDRGKQNWKLFDWKISDNVLSANSLKAEPWTDIFLHENDSGSKKHYVELSWDDAKNIQLLKAPRTYQRSYPWPGKDAKMFVFGKDLDEAPKFSVAWDKHFEAKDIATIKDMKKDNVVYYFLRPEYENK